MLPGVMRRSRTDFEAMAVPDRAFAAVGGQLEILGEFEAVGRASVFAESAEHAAGEVVGEGGQDFATRDIIALPADDDEIFRAGQGAEIARYAKRFAGFGVDIEARGAAISLSHHRPLERILLGVNIFGSLVAEGHPHALGQVHKKKLPEQILHRVRSVPPHSGIVKARRWMLLIHIVI